LRKLLLINRDAVVLGSGVFALMVETFQPALNRPSDILIFDRNETVLTDHSAHY